MTTLTPYTDTIRRLAAQGCTDGRIAEYLGAGVTGSGVWAFRRRHGIRAGVPPDGVPAPPMVIKLPDDPEAAWARAFKRVGRDYAGAVG